MFSRLPRRFYQGELQFPLDGVDPVERYAHAVADRELPARAQLEVDPRRRPDRMKAIAAAYGFSTLLPVRSGQV